MLSKNGLKTYQVEKQRKKFLHFTNLTVIKDYKKADAANNYLQFNIIA